MAPIVRIQDQVRALTAPVRADGQPGLANWEEIDALLGRAESSITFWGDRVVHLRGQDPALTGKISLTWLAQEVHKAAFASCYAEGLSLAARIAGLNVVDKIQAFYAATDEAAGRVGPLTNVFRAVRELDVFDFDNIRRDNAGETPTFFRGFTTTEYERTFGRRVPRGLAAINPLAIPGEPRAGLDLGANVMLYQVSRYEIEAQLATFRRLAPSSPAA